MPADIKALLNKPKSPSEPTQDMDETDTTEDVDTRVRYGFWRLGISTSDHNQPVTSTIDALADRLNTIDLVVASLNRPQTGLIYQISMVTKDKADFLKLAEKRYGRLGTSQPSVSNLYKKTHDQIRACSAFGHKFNWDKDNADDDDFATLVLPDKFALEALRLNGDAREGFRILPRELEKTLEKAGLIWLLQPKNEATIPDFWQSKF
ncbi:hypothetical protein F4818DRAFT_440544 [Hypoxylon cercidicola]|nr:hypothetical protein F4818DRAFT_440544 [Hypoxylon cercidicola]